MHPWFTALEKIEVSDLVVPMAQAFVKFVTNYGEGAATIEGARRLKPGEEIVLIRVPSGRPQRPAYPLLREESLGVLFSADEHYPYVMSTREDFPDTPHQNTPPPGTPFSICIDDRHWADAKITYTPGELLQRIIMWFEKTGKDELHDINQPLDPYFFGGLDTVILPGQVFDKSQNERSDLIVARGNEKARILQLVSSKDFDLSKLPKDIPRCTFIGFEVLPEQMKSRMRAAPDNLAALAAEMAPRGVLLLELISKHISEWITEDDHWKRLRFESPLGILVKMPIIHPRTGKAEGQSIIAFMTNCSLGDVGVALGRLSKNTVSGCDFPYVWVLPSSGNSEQVAEIKLQPANVVASFDPALAAKMAGHKSHNARQIVLVGAGAIGSLVADSLAREGHSNWTVIDDDVLLPHNLTRHALAGNSVVFHKAQCLALHLQLTVLGCVAKNIVTNILTPKETASEVDQALTAADIILDASASVPVSRFLCDWKAKARRAAFFFNPAGTAAVLMIEDPERKVDLRSLEAAFYSQILTDPALTSLLVVPPERIPYSGDCRAMTTRMPSSRANILSGLVAQELSKCMAEESPLLKIWRLFEDGTVTVTCPQPESLQKHHLGEWTIRILPSVINHIQSARMEKLPNETGGALLGVVDIPARQIEVMGALPPPLDSQEEPTGFVRGTRGLRDLVKNSMASTLDHIRYVGEWHSHPRGCGTAPSCIDLRQLSILSGNLSADGCPGVQVILGDSDISVGLGLA